MRRTRKKDEFVAKRDTNPLGYFVDTSYDGVSPLDDPKDSIDKELQEHSALCEWIKSATKQNFLQKKGILRGEDPPDFYIDTLAGLLSVEITELIDGGFRAKQKYAYKHAQTYSPHSGQGFEDAQWESSTFIEKLSSLIREKEEKYSDKKPFDFLLIFSNEFWLTEEKVKLWLQDTVIHRSAQFNHIHLMLDYHPRTKSYPLFIIQ